MSRLALIVLLLSLTLAGCGGAPQTAAPAPAAAGSPPQLAVKEPWVRAAVVTGAAMPMTEATAMPMPEATTASGGHGDQPAMNHGGDMNGGGSTSAAYLTLANGGGTADALIGAATEVAEVVELHTVEMVDNVMKMRPVPQIDIPANGEVALKPGGFHIMLIGLKHDLKAGETVKLTLTFKTSGTIEVEAPVRMP